MPETARDQLRALAKSSLFLAIDTRHPTAGYPVVQGGAVRGADLSEANIRKIALADLGSSHVVGTIASVEGRVVDGKAFERVDVTANGQRGFAYYFRKADWLGMLVCFPPAAGMPEDGPSCDGIAEQNVRANADR